MWVFVHRPFEIYPILGDLQVERLYMVLLILTWVASPEKSFWPNRLHRALVAFTVVVLVCWAASPYRDVTWETVESYLKVMVFYSLVVTTVRDERGLRRLVAMYLTATGLYMGHSLWEYAHGRYESRMGISRMIGVDITYRDSNAFASTLVLALTMTLPFWKASARRWRLALAGFSGCTVLCVLLTGSRAGFIGLCAVGLLLGWQSRHRGRLMVLLGFLGCVSVVALPGYLQNRFLTIIDPSVGPANAQSSAEGRILGFLDGLALWERSPLFGVGPSGFAYATGKGYNPHNLYGQVLGETGTLGTLALAGLLAAFWSNGREARRLRDPAGGADFPAEVARAVGLGVLLLLLQGLGGHNLYRYNWLWLASFQAVALRCLRQRAVYSPLLSHSISVIRRPRLAAT
jgi:O-antigen ligase